MLDALPPRGAALRRRRRSRRSNAAINHRGRLARRRAGDRGGRGVASGRRRMAVWRRRPRRGAALDRLGQSDRNDRAVVRRLRLLRPDARRPAAAGEPDGGARAQLRAARRRAAARRLGRHAASCRFRRRRRAGRVDRIASGNWGHRVALTRAPRAAFVGFVAVGEAATPSGRAGHDRKRVLVHLRRVVPRGAHRFERAVPTPAGLSAAARTAPEAANLRRRWLTEGGSAGGAGEVLHPARTRANKAKFALFRNAVKRP